MDTKTVKTVGPNDQVIITVDDAADLSYLAAVLSINPIEIMFTDVVDGQFSFFTTHPKGIRVSVLQSPKHDHMMCDISNEPYKRCLMDRTPGTGLRLILTKVTDDTIQQLRSYPLVVKPNRDIGVLTAAAKVWRITKTEVDQTPLVADPCTVPAEIDVLMELLDEPVPDELQLLAIHRKRIELRLRFVEWYVKRFIAYDVREYLNARIVELQDAVLDCDRKKLTIAKQSVSLKETYQGLWIESLLQHVPQDVAELLRQDAMEKASKQLAVTKRELGLANRQNQAIDKLDRDSISSLLTDYSLHPGFADVIGLLSIDNYERMPMHNCDSCGCKASLVNIGTPDDKRFTVACSSCANSLPEKNHGRIPYMLICEWNRKNPAADSENRLKSVLNGKFSNLTIGQTLKFQTSTMKLMSIVKRDLELHHKTFGTKVTGQLLSRHSMVTCWLTYIAILCGQSPKTGDSAQQF